MLPIILSFIHKFYQHLIRLTYIYIYFQKSNDTNFNPIQGKLIYLYDL